MIRATVILLTFEIPKDEKDPKALMTFVYIMFGWAIFVGLLYLAFTISLIVGLHQVKRFITFSRIRPSVYY